MKAHNLSKRLWLAVLITIFIFHSLPPLSIYAEGARPDISPAKGVAPMSEDRNGSLEFLPVETIAKISEALNKFIEQKNDTEANIGDTFKEAVNGKDILEEKGYILITNYKNLPEKLIRPDGTIVTYNYEFDENGDISSVALNSQEVTLEINSQRITISSSDGDGPTVIIEAEDGENLLNPPDNLVNYGMVDFRAIQAAFDELESVMNELEKKDSVKTKQALSDSSDADTHGDARVEQAINKCGETVFKIIKKADRSSVEYQRDGLDVFLKAVVVLPEKRR